jgi:PAS domain S-box-containing protein
VQVREGGVDQFLAERAWLFELSLEPMVVGTFDGVLRAVNAAYQRLVGYRLEEILEQPFLHLIHPEDQPRALAQLERLGRGEVARDLELRIRGRHGGYRVVSWTASPSAAEGVFYAVGRDVTEQKHHEERIRRQAELLELAHDAIIERGRGGVVEYWNRGAEQLYGWSRDEALGQTVHHLLKTEFPVSRVEIERQVERTGVWEGELGHWCRDGRHITVLSRWALRRDAAGRQVSMLEINRDITQRKHAEERLVEQARALMRSNADLEQFAYVASHDLVQPLAVISNYADLLADGAGGPLNARALELTRHIIGGAAQLRALIDDLLSYSRIGRAELRCAAVDCNALVGQVLRRVEEGVKEADVVVGSLPTVSADPTQLAQLFQNLIVNAVTFARPGVRARVEVEGHQEDGAYAFSITDNGIGIDAADRTRIFEMFERVDCRADVPGTGIGLAICARVVERHGGRIWVEDAPECGSRFRFTIPASRDGS